jgi:hypothetical protein
VVGVSLTVAGLASAQPPQRGQRQGGGMGGGRATPQFLLNNEAVQKELKLTDEQIEKVKAFAPAQGRGAGGGGGGGGGAGGGGRRGQGNPEAAQAAEKFVKESLTEAQQKRFKQIRFQVMELAAFSNEEVQSALKLTDDQKSKVKTLLEDMANERREIMPQRGGGGGGGGGGNLQEMQEKLAQLNKTYTEKVHGVLTADQKSAWKDLIGAEFKLPAPTRRAPMDR